MPAPHTEAFALPKPVKTSNAEVHAICNMKIYYTTQTSTIAIVLTGLSEVCKVSVCQNKAQVNAFSNMSFLLERDKVINFSSFRKKFMKIFQNERKNSCNEPQMSSPCATYSSRQHATPMPLLLFVCQRPFHHFFCNSIKPLASFSRYSFMRTFFRRIIR